MPERLPDLVYLQVELLNYWAYCCPINLLAAQLPFGETVKNLCR
jgi:hypothetical protein